MKKPKLTVDECKRIISKGRKQLTEAEKRIAELEQKVEDLEGMLGDLPPEGKCAMLLVQQTAGEYVWGCEKYDFASYCLVDSEADMYTGMVLNDPFGRADFADKLTMARELRKMAAILDADGDVLGIRTQSDAFGQNLSESRWHRLFGTPERAAQTLYESTSECGCCAVRDECGYDLDKCVIYDRDALLEWLRGDA